MSAAVQECPPYPYSNNAADYTFGFEGAPFNFTVNCTVFLVSVLIYVILLLAFKSKNFERKRPPEKPAQSRLERFKQLIPYFLRIEQHEFARRSSLDAVAYILTLRYQVFQILALTPLFVIGIPLVNFSQDQKNAFRRLAIVNLRLNDFNGSWAMWGLLLLSTILYYIITLIRFIHMYRWPRRSQICRAWSDVTHQKQLKSKYPCECDLINKPTHVLMLYGLPECNLALLNQLIQDCFKKLQPMCTIDWIQPAYALKNVIDLDAEKARLDQYLQVCLREFANSGSELTYREFTCGCLPTLGERSRAIEVYNRKLVCTDAQLEALLLLYRIGDRRKMSSLGIELDAPHSEIAFVGVNSPFEALELLTQFAPLHGNVLPTNYSLNFIDFGSKSAIHTEIHQPFKKRKGNYADISIPFTAIEMAPPPTDLIWSNIVDRSHKNICYRLRLFVIRILLFLMVLLLSMPSYLLTIISFIGIDDGFNSVGRAIILKVVPAGLLVIIATVIIRISRAIEIWSAHLTRASLEKRVIRNGFWLLFFVILLLPSMGILGAPALYFYYVGFPINSSTTANMVRQFRSECIFLPDTAILFLNFLVTCGVIGSSLQLLRIRYWFKYWLRNTCYTHSRAEKQSSIGQFPAPEFHFGESHAWNAFLQTIIVAYASVCPILYFFGLVAFLFKYVIDKYMLVWVYRPEEIKEVDSQTSDETDTLPDRYLRVYHLNWVLESARLSTIGIFFACINQLVFFGLRLFVYKQWGVVLASAILAFVALVTSIILVMLFSKSKGNFLSLLHSNPILNQNLNSRRAELLRRDSELSLADLGSYSNQNAYTVPVLLKYNTDRSWYSKS